MISTECEDKQVPGQVHHNTMLGKTKFAGGILPPHDGVGDAGVLGNWMRFVGRISHSRRRRHTSSVYGLVL